MSDKEFDPFAPSTGLPDDFDAVVKEAWFEFDPDYQNGQVLVLKLTLETDEEEFGKDHNGVGDLMLSCGKGWTTNDRGATAVRDDGNMRKGFHQSTAYHLWIDGAIKCDGAEKVLRSAERGDPRKAEMWKGTAWHVNRKKISYGGDIGDIDKLIPTTFLGLVDSLAELQRGSGAAAATAGAPAKKAAAPVAKAVKKAAAPAAAAPAANGNGTGINAELKAELKALAMAAETHESFVEQAFELAAVSEDEAVQQAVLDGGEGSIWAEAVAEYQAANA